MDDIVAKFLRIFERKTKEGPSMEAQPSQETEELQPVMVKPQVPQSLTMVTPVTGQRVEFDHPTKTLVTEEDLRRVLAVQRRFGGHCDVTVLQHLYLCAGLADESHPGPVVKGYAAARDLHKAYTGDIISPLKKMFPALVEVDLLWEAHCHVQVGLVWPRPYSIDYAVRRIDARARELELMHCGHPSAGELDGNAYEPPAGKESWLLKDTFEGDVENMWTVVWETIAAAKQALAWVEEDMLSNTAFISKGA